MAYSMVISGAQHAATGRIVEILELSIVVCIYFGKSETLKVMIFSKKNHDFYKVDFFKTFEKRLILAPFLEVKRWTIDKNIFLFEHQF